MFFSGSVREAKGEGTLPFEEPWLKSYRYIFFVLKTSRSIPENDELTVSIITNKAFPSIGLSFGQPFLEVRLPISLSQKAYYLPMSIEKESVPRVSPCLIRIAFADSLPG